MSEYKIHTVETAPEESKEMLNGAEKQLGFIPNLYAIMAEAPAALKAYNGLSQNFESSSLSSTEQQVVLLATSYVNECHYCVAVHSTIAQMQKIDTAIVDAIRSGAPITDSKLEALRKFSQAVVDKRGWISEDDVESFISAGYSQAQLLEVIVGVTQKTLSNYINHIVQTPLDEAFEPNKWEKVEV
ncbi:MAG: carboxymuconolactone decarboxylase family protein [Melioribacteraceae bacterium]|nr:carboxymuconolactone decarboxylase family protein [Melioribacteraceae bacterium]MCF8356586.1 carboxymuconolactone decarboxylase family protein [Melioribacteraceae bacterium]MCF8395975.1 carboxymuconolactone decarboxylase family protein [Melioribacteraceae bacterium]MCF8421026.1 carboxymuconolactone decarboxylase family protein [Melioribacteraceae bacterium]